jgi:hypothetical protein
MSLLDYFSKPNRLVRPEESTSSNHTAATQPSASQDNNKNSQHEGHTVSTYIFFELIKYFFIFIISYNKLESVFSIHKKRYVNEIILQRHNWLAVSKVPGKEGAWCAWCSLFTVTGKVGGKGNQVALGRLVTLPMKNFKDLSGNKGDLKQHEKARFHQQSSERIMEFLARTSDDQPSDLDVRNLLDSARKNAIEENRLRLVPIVEAILFCGRQGIALRGHRDSGRVALEDPDHNDGNFRSLLRFRMRGGDSRLVELCVLTASNAQYCSSVVQNELLDVMMRMLQEQIVEEVKAAKYWSLIADETMDRQKRELLTIVGNSYYP